MSQRMPELGGPWEIKQSNPEETEARERVIILTAYNYRTESLCSMPDAALSTPQWAFVSPRIPRDQSYWPHHADQGPEKQRDSVTTPGPKMTEPEFEPMSDAAVTACNRRARICC